MNPTPKLKVWSEQILEKLRLQLSHTDALPQLAIMGVLSGTLAGLVIISFRLLIEYSQASFLPDGHTENYEQLSPFWWLLLPLLGGITIGLIFQWAGRNNIQVGIVHVLERLAYHQGHLPFRNAVIQFVGAAVSIISGHSVGREGPGVHLGAASGSLLGQTMKLPNNSIRILVGCGTAGAIAASFNTPLAGVIFAMEVVMMEYTIAGFTPIILAAVCATALTQLLYGSEPAFILPSFQPGPISELPFVLILGLCTGALAALFIYLLQRFTNLLKDREPLLRLSLAGLLTGLCAMTAPQIMGIGYDTVNSALIGEIGLELLLLILFLKLLATTAGLGLGLPGGLIGPTLVIGATAGGTIGVFVASTFDSTSSHAYYALLGMGAMMGATLQAPLAALTAMLELTANPNIILPGMLAVIIAGLTSSALFKKKSVFTHLMQARGLDYHHDPVSQALRRIGVSSCMERNFILLSQQQKIQPIQNALGKKPAWIVITVENTPLTMMPAADLSLFTNENPATEELDLMEIPAQRLQLSSIPSQASMQEALETLHSSGAEALYIERPGTSGIERIIGVLTQEQIEASYLP